MRSRKKATIEASQRLNYTSKTENLGLFKLRLSIVSLIAVLAVGSAVILIGFLTNQEYIEVSEITNQIEKLEIYKNELDKINKLNLQMLEDLETQITNSNDVNL